MLNISGFNPLMANVVQIKKNYFVIFAEKKINKAV